MNTGNQKAVVLSNWLGASASGTMFVGLKFQVGDNEVIPGFIYITDKSLSMAIKSFAALGVDFAKQDLQEFDSNKELLLGREVEIDIQEEEYKGKSSLKVVRIGPENLKPDKDKIARYNAKLKALAGKGEPPEEDLPF